MAVAFEKALEKARTLKPTVDNCIEYENGYAFMATVDEEYPGKYHHLPIVILKNGMITTMSGFVAYGMGRRLRKITLSKAPGVHNGN